MRWFRLLSIAMGVGLLAFVWHGVAAPRAVSAIAATDASADLARFRAELARFRAGEDALEASLDALARGLDTRGRPDVLRVLDHYRELTREERAAGLADEAQYERLWDRAGAAQEEGLEISEWRAERARIVAELDAFIERVRSAPDGVPLARALSLRARLVVERVENDYELLDAESGRLARAAEHDAESARLLLERAGFLTPQLEPLWLLARLAAQRGEVGEADLLYGHCLEIARAVSNDDYAKHALHGMLRQAHSSGDQVDIARLVGELAELESVDESWPLAQAHADWLLQRDEGARAAAFLVHHPPTSAYDRRDWTLLLSSAQVREGRFAEASARLDDATGSTLAKQERDLAHAVLELGAQRPERALELAQGLCVADGKNARLKLDAAWIEGAALLRLGRVDEARDVLARTLEAARDEEARLLRAAPGATTHENVMGEVLGLHAVALYAEACVRSGRAAEAALAIERTQARNLRRELAEDGPAPELTRADLESWAQAYEGGLVTWVVGADASVVVLVPQGGDALGAVIDRGRRSIELAARRLREAALSEDPLALQLAAEIQAELLPGEIGARLAAAPAGRMLCLLHGPLEALAVELWPVFADGELAPLCLPGLPTARPSPESALVSNARWNLLGAPLDEHGHESLPGARGELEGLAAMHTGSVLALGAAYDRDALVRALLSDAPLHVATHIVYGCGESGQFAASGLELTGGLRLCAREIAELHPRLPLAFLAACESGSGRFVDAQGLQGVARAFLASGTQSLLVTLWPVEDGAARDYALEFHRALQSGLSPGLAAAEARQMQRSRGRPLADWAAFRALGRD